MYSEPLCSNINIWEIQTVATSYERIEEKDELQIIYEEEDKSSNLIFMSR